MSAGKALRDPVEEQQDKAANGRPKIFLGPQDAAVMLRRLRASVSTESPKGLACDGKIQRTDIPGLWVCEAVDLETRAPRGKRWLRRKPGGFDVLRADPRVPA